MAKNSDELGFTSVFRTLLKSEQEEAPHVDPTEPHASPLIIPGDVERAFENGEFRVYYQPKVLATTAEIVGAEALLRWQHPEFGVLTPNYFIPGMEKSGLIHEVGAWVLRRVSELNLAISSRITNPSWNIAVNVSPVQFGNPAYLRALLRAAKSLNLPNQLLEIELTETAVLESFNQAAELMALIREYGVTIAIDDFGVGFNSISHLARLPISAVKIDASFVGRLEHSEVDRKIVSALIRLSHDLGMKTVAEGVETMPQAQFLLEQNCQLLQGFFFGRPVPQEEFVAKLPAI
ncbi:MAG: diguanylate cyclase [Betaproteobacteria bacterium]|nr:diguanylate cyclase [Betaproteobacteria bacterium]